MDFSTIIPWICTSLNCPSTAELGNWTEAELYAYAEEALNNAGGKFLLVAEFDDSTAIVAGQPMYELPSEHLATVWAAVDGTALKPATTAEMEALDDLWEEAASGTAARWVGDALGQGVVRLYPPPASGTALQLIFQKSAPDVTAAAPVINVPAPVADYMAMKTLEQARRRQGDAQMLDAAQVFANLAGLYEQAMAAYWGAGA